MQKLDLYRNKIDKIDENILKLLNQRAEIVLNIGKVKKEKKARFFVPGREREIFARLNRMHQGAFPKDALRTIFREILSASLSLESPIRVAYLGPEATFSHLASLREFGSSADLVPALSIRDIFEGLECRRTDYGVVPIENSNEGVVGQTLDLFVASPVQIVGEVIQEISHFLLSKSGRMKGIRKIYSHPQAISQCRLWIESHLKGVELVEVFSTTQAAERSKKDAKSAAIASELAGRLYGLRVVEPHIEDHANNVTRFLVISLKGLQKTGKDKTSILFSVKDRVGALNGVLKPFAQHRINLSRIESRPSKKKPWEYIFYVDLEGHQSDLPVKRALKALDTQCNFLKILGSYPKSSGES